MCGYDKPVWLFNLAYCEFYLTPAAVFAAGILDFDCFRTDVSNIEVALEGSECVW